MTTSGAETSPLPLEGIRVLDLGTMTPDKSEGLRPVSVKIPKRF